MYSYNLTRVFRYSFFKVLCFRCGLVSISPDEPTLRFTHLATLLTLPRRGTLVGDGDLSSRSSPSGFHSLLYLLLAVPSNDPAFCKLPVGGA
jgi:hypothetical protein